MDFLGIGPLELIVVMIIAFIVVGPERLPELARSVGKTLRDMRALSQGLTNEWQREIDSVSRTETGEGLQESLTRPFKEAQAELQQALSPSSTSPSDATAEPAPLEASPEEQPDILNGDVENDDT
jgi:Tat protein translocase TatB subunit